MLPEKKQVLIVDDEPNLRKILAAQLSRDGYEVMLAEDGEQGLTMLRENHIDLVVTDLKMPKVDGMTLLREALREKIGLPNGLSAEGVTKADIPKLSDKAMEDACKALNPRPVTRDDIVKLYELSL